MSWKEETPLVIHTCGCKEFKDGRWAFCRKHNQVMKDLMYAIRTQTEAERRKKGRRGH